MLAVMGSDTTEAPESGSASLAMLPPQPRKAAGAPREVHDQVFRKEASRAAVTAAAAAALQAAKHATPAQKDRIMEEAASRVSG